jgi:hypothetical protein
VLGPGGGALKPQLPVFKAGLGAPLGSGRQWLPWISLHDELEAVVHCLDHEVSGPVNLVAPAPVTNRVFTKALGKALHRPTLPVPVPGFVLAAMLGQFAGEGVLIGQRLQPAVLERTGSPSRTTTSRRPCARRSAGPDLDKPPTVRPVEQLDLEGRLATTREAGDDRACGVAHLVGQQDVGDEQGRPLPVGGDLLGGADLVPHAGRRVSPLCEPCDQVAIGARPGDAAA